MTKENICNILSIFAGVERIVTDKPSDMQFEQKSGIANLVTRTDKQLDAYITKCLTNLFPDATVISEESSDDAKCNPKATLKFVVDPLDGTTNYTNNWPHTVSIGVIENNELVAGFIYDVLAGTIYVGQKDCGVFLIPINKLDDELTPVERPVYSQTKIKKAVINFDTPYGAEAFKTTLEMYSKLYHSGASMKTVGPISLDVLKTALGKENRPHDYNHATWHTEVRAWDLCAATCILRELGGEITSLEDGRPLSTKTLSNPDARISFIACGSEELRTNIYKKFKNF